MFWADEIVDGILKTFPEKRRFIIRDEKTPSGRVHVGSVRGVVIHGIVAQALQERGFNAEFIYELNDADPMDGLPIYLDREKFLPFMGKPLKDVPSPNPTYKNYAEYFGKEFVSVIERLGFHPKIVWNSDLYAEGQYDPWIDIVLEKSDQIRLIYREVSGSEKSEEWNPVQIVCENCGKVGTTTVTASSGPAGKKIVEYICEPKKVKWATGCGYHGKTAPYKGRGKLPWKVEWAVKWQVYEEDIEGAGKDHIASGGSHDVASRIAKEVLSGRVPFNIPYEHFLIGGAKMSSSKGLGASAKEVADLLPPELLRFLMVRTRPNQAIDFNPEGMTIPRVYDRYDESAEVYFERKHVEAENDVKRSYYFSELHPRGITDHFRPRFSLVAFFLQIPSVNFWKEIEKLKGKQLTKEDRQEAESRRIYATLWLEKYAPEDEKYIIQKSLPDKAQSLSNNQKEFLQSIARLLREQDWTGEALHAALHDLRKKSLLQPKEAFSSIYLVLLGKDSGPQAGWFLTALDKNFVIQRFEELNV